MITKKSKIISANIRFIRKNANRLTQQKFAQLLGCTRSNLGSYEENRAKAPLEILIAISELTWLPLNDLMKADLTKRDTDDLLIKKTAKKILDGANDKVIAVVTITPKKQIWIIEKTIA